jgi:hypothetical protein
LMCFRRSEQESKKTSITTDKGVWQKYLRKWKNTLILQKLVLYRKTVTVCFLYLPSFLAGSRRRDCNVRNEFLEDVLTFFPNASIESDLACVGSMCLNTQWGIFMNLYVKVM